MVTSALEYYSKLNLVLNENPPAYAILPTAENIYNIDLNSREIDAPPFLGVEKDHKSETIYFIVDRYADYIDLATTSCMIIYTNVNAKESRIYNVPFYDIYTYAKEGKMLIPWCLDAAVAAAAGPVQFAIQFYKIGEAINSLGIAEKVLSFNLNTLPATSKVLEGMEVDRLDSDYLLNATQAQDLQKQIDNLVAMQDVYWTILS